MIWSPVHSASYLLFLVLPITYYGAIITRNSSSPCRLESAKCVFEYEYYREGEIIIGGLISVHSRTLEHKVLDGSAVLRMICVFLSIEEYRSILALIFAVNEINKDPDLLPNITLGYHIFNTCGDPKKTLDYVLQILSGRTMEAPNYSFRKRGEVVGFIGDSGFQTSHTMAQLLNVYRYTQINYKITDPLLSNKQIYPNLFRMIQDDHIYYIALIKCLKHFGWNWVGMVTPYDGSGDMEIEELRKVMAKNEICIAYTIQLANDADINIKKMSVISHSEAKVVIMCGRFTIFYIDFWAELVSINWNITLILHESWTDLKYMDPEFFPTFNSTLIFLWPQKFIPNMETFIYGVNPSNRPTDPLLEEIWLQMFQCLSRNPRKNAVYELVRNFSGTNCSGTGVIPQFALKDSKPSYAYIALYVLAHALHNINLLITNKSKNYRLQQMLPIYLRKVYYKDPTGEVISFSERQEVPSKLVLSNWIVNTSEYSYIFHMKPLASIDDSLQENQSLNINPDDVLWKGGKVPKSRCNPRCHPGYRKAPNVHRHVCCYDCVPCSSFEISNITDSESCYRCPDEEWPDERKVKCIPKTYDFLSYENDTVVLVITMGTVIGCAITLFVLGSFIYHRNTPIVKANNRNVSFILLTSIFMSFFSVFLFLGRPVDITCMLRQASFGIFFTISVSSVLAKTIIVCIAFKATKPSSYWRKWVGVKVPYFVVLICSSVQVLICIIWLSVSSPYQEYDMSSYPGKIIIQCNEGSVICFYSVLGYLGFLAAVSFVLAFMVRTLPDSFNEAKYITFSMLVFCSVWIAMIPAYLSTRGKYMVAVEIFAILASSGGILSCIFFHKLYILILMPEMNTIKKGLMEKNVL